MNLQMIQGFNIRFLPSPIPYNPDPSISKKTNEVFDFLKVDIHIHQESLYIKTVYLYG